MMNDCKEKVIEAGKVLVNRGLVARTWGNVSCRVPNNAADTLGEVNRRTSESAADAANASNSENFSNGAVEIDPCNSSGNFDSKIADRFAISPSGRDYFSIKSEDVPCINTETGEMWEEQVSKYGKGLKPSSEKELHRLIYLWDDECNFIIHTHQENASVAAAMGLKKLRIVKESETEILCADHGMPGTEDLAKKTLEAVKKSKAPYVLMANHGAVVWGRTMEEALERASELEKICGDFLKEARVPLGDEALERFRCEGKAEMPAYIDDYAQMIGPSSVIAFDDDHMPRGSDTREDDRGVEPILIAKNCRAMYAAEIAGGRKPIDRTAAAELHKEYLESYSKLK